MGTAALHSRAASGQEGRKKNALWRFLVLNFKREKEKKTFPRILFITPGINSAYYDQL